MAAQVTCLQGNLCGELYFDRDSQKMMFKG